MIVLVDMDGVLADCEASLYDCIQRDYPECKLPTPENRTTFYLEDEVGLDVAGHHIHSYMEQEGFFRGLKIMPGAVEGINELISRGHTVKICTAPISSIYCAKEKMEWIFEHFPVLERDVIVTKDKTIIRGDVLIDDKWPIKGAMVPEWRQVIYKSGKWSPGTFTWENMSEFYEIERQYENRVHRLARNGQDNNSGLIAPATTGFC